MPKLRFQPRTRGLALLAVALLSSTAFAARGTLISKRARVVLEVRPLSAAEPARTAPAGPLRMSVDPKSGSELAFDLLGAGGERSASIRLVARELPPSPDQPHRVALEAEIELADGRRLQASRSHGFDDSSTFLFELYRGQRPVVLVVEASTELETVVASTPAVGDAVVLDMEIQNVSDGKTVSLETNRLSTFVGHDVSYSFKLGDAPESTAIDVRFTPLRVVGEIA